MERNEEEAYQRYEKARSCMDAGNFSQAAVLFQESIALSVHAKALELLGECLCKTGDFQQAIVPLAAATTLNNQGRAPALLAEVFLHLGEVSDAQAVAEIALQRDKGNKKALHVIEKISR
ncbi:hypothetical protein MRY87_02315 [bacterium]|nr:hypothetical protein [bacterium]